MSTNYYDAENNKLIPIAGKGDFPADYGTKEEFESKKDSLPDGTVFTTTDEFVESSSLQVEELWSNPNPNVAFTAQTISIPNLSRYKLILFETRYHTTAGFIETKTIVNTPHSTLINTNFFGGTSRDIEIKSDSIVFGSGKFYPTYAAGTFNTDNNFCYPNKIYGIR